MRGDLAADCRSEVQAERARDDQLARRPATSWRGDLGTQEFSQRHREQRPDHPRKRSAQRAEQDAAHAANRERLQDRIGFHADDFIFRRKTARRFDRAGHPPKTPR